MEGEVTNSPDHFVSTKEAAKILGYTVQHLRLLIRQGQIEATKFGRDWLISRESLAKYRAKKGVLR
jgi:excisionase family DNA binding protein